MKNKTVGKKKILLKKEVLKKSVDDKIRKLKN